MSQPVCLLGAFARHLQSRPDALLYRYLLQGNPSGEVEEWTYAETYARSAAVAELVAEHGFIGKRVLLLSQPGLDYVATFLGCLMARVVVVPAYPPAASRIESTVPRLVAIADAAQIDGVLTTAGIAGEARSLLAGTPVHDVPWLCTDVPASQAPRADWLARPASEALAYLQFTSGSTSEPKGVMVTHGNVAHNSDLIRRKFGHSSETRGMSWLPPYHDMGLIGGVIQPLYTGGEVTLMSPVDFLMRPSRWIEGISRFRVTTTGGPDFGYALCARRFRPGTERIDLSSWRVAFNGAEQIRRETLDRFCETFGPHGFERRAFYPCYGLAEATLIVTGGEADEPPLVLRAAREELARGKFVAAADGEPAIELVSCGTSAADQQLAIVDLLRKTRVADGIIGEIWVAGASVAAGYWDQPEATRASFAARLEDEPAAGPFARTGDLGFLADGQLYVTGRHKDLIIIRGRNLYPQDIEDTVAGAHPAIRAGSVAAFSTAEGMAEGIAEGIAIAAEVTGSARQEVTAVIEAIRRAVAAAHHVGPTEVFLLPGRAIPKTSSGKLQRAACRAGIADGSIAIVARWRADEAMESESSESSASGATSATSATASSSAATTWAAARLRDWLRDAVAARTGLPAATIDLRRPLVEYGLDSVAGVELSGELQGAMGRPVSATLAWDYPTIEAIAAHLGEPATATATATATTRAAPAPRDAASAAIAIVAVGCRFPGGVDGPEALWQLLCSGEDPIRPIPASRWDSAAQLAALDPAHRDAARVGGFIDQVDELDASFFAISPREAQSMDPQQRLLLEVSYEALDRAGLTNGELPGSSIGVFVGISSNDYYRRQERAGVIDPRYSVTGNLASVAAGRVAYVLGLVGPAISIDTACSSSLAAVHLACQSLRAGECEQALAGGVNLMLAPEGHAYFSAMQATSRRGRCASFDASADGYVRSEGCGMVLLKPLEAAQRAGDRILAVIRGSAINHDGRSNGLTAPNGPSQEAVIRQALARASVAPEQVSYVETHGTGTPLGDPIEVQALAGVFAAGRSMKEPLRIGSAKSNLGHAEAAAGIAGLIKTALALEAEALPGNLHFRQPSPHIRWAELPLSVVAENLPWPRTGGARFAGVSSFGFSGTNVHVVLEQAPAAAPRSARAPGTPQLFAVSAHCAGALDARLGQLEQLAGGRDVELGDLAFSVSTSSNHLPARAAWVASRPDSLGAAVARGRREPRSGPIRKVGFLFGGQGVQRLGMGQQLAARWPVVADALRWCDERFAAASGLPRGLREVMWAAPGTAEAALLQHTEYTQPALFAFEYALVCLWRSLGVTPDVVIGHSIGELAAACAAGVMEPAAAMNLVVARGLGMAGLSREGAMISVAASEEEVAAMIRGRAGMAIAAINGPRLVVVAGPAASVADLEQQAATASWHTSRLAVSHAFHSPLMEPMVEELSQRARRIRYQPPQLPFLSTVTASLAGEEIACADYWTRHVVAPVRFHQAMTALPEDIDALVEVSPQPTLIAMATRARSAGERRLIASVVAGREDEALLEAVAALYQGGRDLDLTRLFDGDRRRVALPAYPWQRQRYWIDEAGEPARATSPAHLSQSGRLPLMPNRPIPSSSDDLRSSARQHQILTSLSQLLAHQLRMPVAELDPRRPFLALGADSMVFLEIVHRIERDFGVKILPHQLFEELTDLTSLAAFVERHEVTARPASDDVPAPAAATNATTAAAATNATTATTATTATARPGPKDRFDDRLQPVIAAQLELMSQQLRLLAADHAATERELPAPAAVRPAPAPDDRPTGRAPAPAPSEAPASSPTPSPSLSAAQRRYLIDFTRRYATRTASSKERSQRYREVLADRRSIAGFARETKELQYPIVGASAQGAHLRDLDGNDYLDVSMGFGVHLFGHAPDFLRQAISAQLAEGAQLGPQCARAGELAEHLARMTGLERVAFCSSGTEAVMTALRLARAATGRDGVVLFRGSYHGHSDGTLALGRRGADGHPSIPMAPGIPQGAVDDVIVLDYDDPSSLEVIRAAADRLAAVLVEPVQSRRPDVQPRGFLQRLRALTRELDIALVFDEVITGFRVHPRGAQGLFGVDADLATYGKLIGGGLPIGVVAGARRYLDRIDGGAWRFGDDSRPEVETTFFAGTFAKHPLTVAASLAVVRELEARGPALYAQLEARTARLARGMNELFTAEEVPLSLVHCGSIFRIAPRGGNDRSGYLYESLELRMLYAQLIHKGIYVWEGRTGFLSTAHSDEDVDRIVAATAEAIAELRGGGFFARAGAGAAPSRPVELERAPLSWAQEGMWVQSQLESGTGSFNMPGGVRLRGQLRVGVLERAIGEVVRRHAVLRTRFETLDGSPQQVITPAAELKIAIAHVDWQGRGDAQGEALRQLAVEEARRPFDLERGPLLRVTLITLAADEWVLLVTMHHLVGDGWSFGLFVRELSALYRAACGDGAAALPPPALSYAEFAREQRERLDEGALDRQLAYWKAQLEGAPASLSLPTDRPRHDGAAGRSATLAQAVAPELLRSLQELARRSNATLHMVLLGAYAALLQRHSGQDDLVIGAPVTTRDRAELSDVMGLFVNTVVFRLAVDRQQSFAALIGRTRLATIGAYAHQDVPFGHVVRAVQPERIPGRHPLFQVWFNLEPGGDAAELRLPGIEAELLDEPIDTPTQLDLSLGAELRGGSLVLKWIYDETTFDRTTIAHLSDQLVHLLAQVVARPDAALTSYSLVTARAAEVLPDPSAPLSTADYPRVTDWFAGQVDRAADHAAIVQGARSWSYAELWRATVDIADGLAAQTRRGDVVAVRGAPSFGLISAMMGVLLHDRVLLPVDPQLPASRQAAMLRDAGARCVVHVGRDAEPDLGYDVGCARVTADDAGWTAPSSAGADAGLPGAALPRQLGDAYIFYTSGTTGTPKGVLGTHRGLSHFIEWQRTEFDVGPADRIAQTMRLSFDAVLRDVFLPLCSGATLVLPDEHDLAEPASVLAWLERQHITLLHTVPSLGQHWTAHVDAGTRLPELRRVFFAGEPLQGELVQRFRQLAPAAEVINLYGPTETTMIKCYFRVPDETSAGVQPAGGPLPHTQALVLSPERARCGVGEIGEIVLRTAYATRGYLDAPESTTARFITNPHLPEDGIRLYCTGDRGRYRADGQLQILGRTDRQIKLRGVRIELAELESVLGEHPRIRQASVQVVGDDPATRRLVAFLVVDDGASQLDVMAFLRARLPEAMVPGRLVFTGELPRLSNGKVDAAALTALAAAPVPARAATAPMTPTQALVAEYARDLLKVETLGIHDDFFEIGGHSLLGAQLVARLRRALAMELNLRALFDNPTVAKLSEHIDSKGGASERSLALALRPRASDGATGTAETAETAETTETTETIEL
jgi:amino acid adenylation domain-containing protein